MVNIEGTRLWGTIGLWALSESWRTGARLAAVIEAVARLAAVIDWAWKAEIGLGNQEWGGKVGIGRGKLELISEIRLWA